MMYNLQCAINNIRNTKYFFSNCKFFFLFFLFGLNQIAVAQVSKDTISVLSKKDSVVLNHSPSKASLLSMALPGAGQFYNKKYWKIPIIYAGFAGMGYLIHFNDVRYQKYKKAYVVRLDNDSNSVDEFNGIYSDSDLKTLKDFYRRNRDLSIIVTGLIYILNIVDASVDAHLFYFDVNEDLSLHLQPSIDLNAQNKAVTGLSVHFTF